MNQKAHGLWKHQKISSKTEKEQYFPAGETLLYYVRAWQDCRIIPKGSVETTDIHLNDTV